MQQRILVIGSLNMDMFIEMTRIPEVGETVLGNSLSYMPGGKGANQACALGKMGADVKMLGCIGRDNFGQEQIDNLTASKVDMSAIKITDETTTGMAIINVDDKGNNNIVVVPGANMACDIEYLQDYDHLFRESDYIVFQMEIPLEAVYYGIQKAKELGKTVILNPAPAPDFIPDEVLKDLDYITPNETELMKLCNLSGLDEDSVKSGVQQLLDKGVKNVLVTMGADGVLLAEKEETEMFPAFKVKALDTTAAGDCFNGAFTAGLASGMDKRHAILFANMASSIAVTRKGAQNSIPALEEVTEKLREYEEREV